MSNKQALTMYKSKILPYAEYGNILFHNTNYVTLNKLQLLQNRALRVVHRCPPRTTTASLHTDSKLNYLVERRASAIRKLAYKRKDIPTYIVIPIRHTRLHDAAVLNTVTAKGKAVERSVHYKCADAWNNLPVPYRNTVNFSSFVRKEKDILRLARVAY